MNAFNSLMELYQQFFSDDLPWNGASLGQALGKARDTYGEIYLTYVASDGEASQKDNAIANAIQELIDTPEEHMPDELLRYVFYDDLYQKWDRFKQNQPKMPSSVYFEPIFESSSLGLLVGLYHVLDELNKIKNDKPELLPSQLSTIKKRVENELYLGWANRQKTIEEKALLRLLDYMIEHLAPSQQKPNLECKLKTETLPFSDIEGQIPLRVALKNIGKVPATNVSVSIKLPRVCRLVQPNKSITCEEVPANGEQLLEWIIIPPINQQKKQIIKKIEFIIKSNEVKKGKLEKIRIKFEYKPPLSENYNKDEVLDIVGIQKQSHIFNEICAYFCNECLTHNSLIVLHGPSLVGKTYMLEQMKEKLKPECPDYQVEYCNFNPYGDDSTDLIYASLSSSDSRPVILILDGEHLISKGGDSHHSDHFLPNRFMITVEKIQQYLENRTFHLVVGSTSVDFMRSQSDQEPLSDLIEKLQISEEYQRYLRLDLLTVEDIKQVLKPLEQHIYIDPYLDQYICDVLGGYAGLTVRFLNSLLKYAEGQKLFCLSTLDVEGVLKKEIEEDSAIYYRYAKLKLDRLNKPKQKQAEIVLKALDIILSNSTEATNGATIDQIQQYLYENESENIPREIPLQLVIRDLCGAEILAEERARYYFKSLLHQHWVKHR